jgi:uncharacterized membrane protein YraQ (UPF0718 family)
MTVLRPVAAFITAFTAGFLENLTGESYKKASTIPPDLTCTVDACCDGIGCDPKVHAAHHSFQEKLIAGTGFAFSELMADIAKWFLLGILLAGIIEVFIPEGFFSEHLGAGLPAYLAVMSAALPMYICASMSTPVAAALIIKGLSPGAALVLLMAGPATNIATITMVWGILGRRTLIIYLFSIVVCTLVLAFATDAIYQGLGIPAQAVIGQTGSELLPEWLQVTAAAILAFFLIRVYVLKLKLLLLQNRAQHSTPEDSAGCNSCGNENSDSGGT